jgi:glycosyltransferase involved in cell wall biosynthesis
MDARAHRTIRQPMNRKLNIALVVDAIEVGGVETYLFNLQRYFKENGHNAEIIACSKRGNWWETAKSLGVSCISIPQSIFSNKVRHAKKIGRFLTNQAYDCIFLNHSMYGQASLGMLPQHVIAIPVIHNDDESIYKMACSNSICWNLAIGVSQKVTENAKKILPEKSIQTIFNGVHVPPIETINQRVVLDGKIKLLFIGRISHDQKGVLYLPEILKRCIDKGIDASLTVVGNGNSLDNLKNLIHQQQISDRVEFVGVISPDRVYQKMLYHHILLMPSHFEGFGLVAVEAQACGCVPIASRLHGITDCTIEDGKTGMLVNVGDIDTFATNIEKIYNDPLLWQRMSKRGHSKVERQFSAAAMGRAYMQVIHDALLGKYPLHIQRNQCPQIDNSLLRNS